MLAIAAGWPGVIHWPARTPHHRQMSEPGSSAARRPVKRAHRRTPLRRATAYQDVDSGTALVGIDRYTDRDESPTGQRAGRNRQSLLDVFLAIAAQHVPATLLAGLPIRLQLRLVPPSSAPSTTCPRTGTGSMSARAAVDTNEWRNSSLIRTSIRRGAFCLTDFQSQPARCPLPVTCVPYGRRHHPSQAWRE